MSCTSSWTFVPSLSGKWFISLTMFRFSFTRIDLCRMVTMVPVVRDLMLCFHRDSIPYPLGPYDKANSCHIRLISAFKLPFRYYRRSVYYSLGIYCGIY